MADPASTVWSTLNLTTVISAFITMVGTVLVGIFGKRYVTDAKSARDETKDLHAKVIASLRPIAPTSISPTTVSIKPEDLKSDLPPPTPRDPSVTRK